MRLHTMQALPEEVWSARPSRQTARALHRSERRFGPTLQRAIPPGSRSGQVEVDLPERGSTAVEPPGRVRPSAGLREQPSGRKLLRLSRDASMSYPTTYREW